MADVAVPYVLATPGGTVTFNSGTDQFFIEEIQGLGGTPVRAPIDPMPFGHGALWHNFWEDARYPIVDGFFDIRSTRIMNNIVVIRNQMEETLRVACRSIGADVLSVGTLAWTPQGQSARSLTVRCNVQPDFIHEENYTKLTFHFGLVAADPDWDGWSS